jgi:pyrimidine-nucleoside phosphorylase
LEKFREIVVLQGGDPAAIDDYSRLPTAPNRHVVAASRSGFIADLHAEKIGIGAMLLGAGREQAEDGVDHAVGVVIRAHVGERVRAGESVLEIHYRDQSKLGNALSLLREAIRIDESVPSALPLIHEVVTA